MTSHLFPVYARSPLAFSRGEGSYLIGTNGERYLDFAAGIAVNALGHGHADVIETLKRQGETLWHVSNLYTIPEQEALASRLCDLTFADRVFFTNSGAEALECAIKTTRRYFYSKGQAEKNRIITMTGAFHGRTLATIAAACQKKMLEGFAPDLEGFDLIPFNDANALEGAITNQTAAILLEPIQGEGGINVAEKAFLQKARELCDKNDLLLIFDEVQSGMGRTGDLFAYQTLGVCPDIMAIAKGIGAGFPLGACLTKEDIGSIMIPGTHGSTYGGNPLACAVGLTVLNIIAEEGFLKRVRETARYARQKFASLGSLYPHVFGGLRGEGLMIGLETRQAPRDVANGLRDYHLLTVASSDGAIRILPPLTVTEQDIDRAMEALERYAGDQPES